MLNTRDVEIIRNVVIEVIEPRLSGLEIRLENKIDEKIGELALITKHGFDEVHARLDNIEHRLERVEEIVLPAAGYSMSAS